MSGQKIIDGLNEAIAFAKAISEATAIERERCARIAERDGSAHDATLSQQTAEWHARVNAEVRTADRIARAIRNPTPEAS